MKSNNITVLIPIHTVKGNTQEYFKTAIKSLQEQQVLPYEVLIVRCPCKDVIKFVDNFDYGNLSVRVVENKESKDFCTQINVGVNEVKTEYFSYLELDDEMSKIWIKNGDKYIESYPDVSVFLPITVDVNEEGKMISFTNEPVWAMQFSDELGYLDNNVLQEYPNFNPSGSIIKKEVFQTVGGLKKSIKLYFNYEFLLRVTYNGHRVMTIPKIGYKHVNMREGSLFWSYKNDKDEQLTPNDAKKYYEMSKKEYYFAEDRN
jgi:GT2 family glycosyltransferase